MCDLNECLRALGVVIFDGGKGETTPHPARHYVGDGMGGFRLRGTTPGPPGHYIEETGRALQGWVVRCCLDDNKDNRRAARAGTYLRMVLSRVNTMVTWLRFHGKDGLADGVHGRAQAMLEQCPFSRHRGRDAGAQDTSDDRAFDERKFQLHLKANGFQEELKRIAALIDASRRGQQAPGDAAEGPRTETDWRDVQDRLLRLYNAGEAYTSQRDLAKRMECVESTINKAVNDSAKLKGWMVRHTKRTPRAQSLNEVVTDSTASQREADPAAAGLLDDEVDRIMSWLIEQAEPDKRATLNELDDDGRREMAKLCLEQQADKYIEDKAPKGNRILGRKP